MDLGVAWLIQNQILFATPQVYMSKLGFIFQPFYICTTPCIATTSQVKRHYKEDEGCTSGGPVGAQCADGESHGNEVCDSLVDRHGAIPILGFGTTPK